MKREEVERIFCWKISAELKSFKYRIMQLNKEQIYASAYQIDCMIRIYELLIEKCKRLETAQLQNCMQISSLLSFVYDEWMKAPDSQETELGKIIEDIMESKIPKIA